MAFGLFTSNQITFGQELSKLTGLDPNVIGAWMLTEESGSAALSRQQQGNNNWLNIGYFDSGPGAITGSKYFNSPVTAAQMTAQFLKGQWGGSTPAIQSILGTANQSPQNQIKAIASSGWATNPKYGSNITSLYDTLKQGSQAFATASKGGSDASTGGVAGGVGGLNGVGGIGDVASIVSQAFNAIVGDAKYAGVLVVALVVAGFLIVHGVSSGRGQSQVRVVPV